MGAVTLVRWLLNDRRPKEGQGCGAPSPPLTSMEKEPPGRLGNKTAAEGITALAELSEDAVEAYMPYWAALGHLLLAEGRTQEARAALTRAAGLTEDTAVKRFLLAKAHIATAI